jgi:hypothetical protein
MEYLIAKCVADMEAAAAGKIVLEAQKRAYDLLQALSEASDGGVMPSESACMQFCNAYEAHSMELAAAFDADALTHEHEAVIEPLKRAMNDARFEAAGAASLHEYAKEVFEIWQTSGVFARRRALRELRERAGFRLESHRIGNYVAKTFDLMNEAQVRFATAQQRVFAADIRFKISPDLHSRVSDLLASRL